MSLWGRISHKDVCADDVTAGSAGGGVCDLWTVAVPSERHWPTAVLDNTADAGLGNTIHGGQKWTAATTATFAVRRLTVLTTTTPLKIMAYKGGWIQCLLDNDAACCRFFGVENQTNQCSYSAKTLRRKSVSFFSDSLFWLVMLGVTGFSLHWRRHLIYNVQRKLIA